MKWMSDFKTNLQTNDAVHLIHLIMRLRRWGPSKTYLFAWVIVSRQLHIHINYLLVACVLIFLTAFCIQLHTFLTFVSYYENDFLLLSDGNT
jgi:hypothetical protein